MRDPVSVIMHNNEVVARIRGHFNVVNGGCLVIVDELGLSTAYAPGQWDVAFEETDDE